MEAHLVGLQSVELVHGEAHLEKQFAEKARTKLFMLRNG
jgi:hypothetical protein